MGPSSSINQPTTPRDVRCSCQASTCFSGEADDNKAEEKASEQFLGRSMPLAPEKTSTPLTGAALSSNWVLFETIYDKFESLTGKKWSRDEVCKRNEPPLIVPPSVQRGLRQGGGRQASIRGRYYVPLLQRAFACLSARPFYVDCMLLHVLEGGGCLSG